MIDMYDSREMTRSLSQMYKATTWLRDLIFGDVELHNSQYVDIDVEIGSRQVAPYVNPLHEGKKVDRDPYSTNTFKVPYSKPKMVASAQEFLKRKPGQTMYEVTDSSGTRAVELLGKDLRYLSEMLDRLEELQCSQALQTGKVTVHGEGISAEIDFGFVQEQLPVLQGNDQWTDWTNSDPQKNLSDWFDYIEGKSGLVPANVIMGRKAIHNYIRNNTLKDLLDNRRIEMGQIVPSELKDMGVRYYGYLADPGIDIWTYSAWYYDEKGRKMRRYIDDNKVIMWGQNPRATRHYGAIQDVENFEIVDRFAKSWVTKDPSARWVMVQSAPLAVPHQVDAFLCATVCDP